MMKKILIILFVLASGIVSGQQRVFSPSVDGVPGRNQPVGISGFALDARSQYHDTTIFPATWRDFQSVAEANAYFNTATKRKGYFPIYVHSGGSLSAGVWTGGTMNEYLYKDGVADINLVIKNSGSAPISLAADSTDIRGAMHVNWYGNSLGYSSGGTTTTSHPNGVPIAQWLTNISGYDVVSFSIPGQSSTQIKNRLLADIAADPLKRFNSFIFEMGENNLGDRPTVEADIAAAVAAIGHNRYLITSVPGQSSSTFWKGAPERNGLDTLNAHLQATYGVRYADVFTGLVEAYNPEIPQDVVDYSHKIPPTSLMAPGDVVHYNDLGYKVWAAAVAPKMYLLKPVADAKALSTQNLHEIFYNAPPIKSSLLLTKRISVNTPNISNQLFVDGNGASNFLTGEYNGGVAFWNQTASPAKAGGIMIKNRYADQGGRANMEISGTSGDWTSGKGMVFRNDVLGIDMGAPLDITNNLTVRGNTSFTGSQNIFNAAVYGSGGFSNVYPIPSGIPLNIESSTNGIRIPLLSNAVSIALHNGGFASTPVGQLWFNDELRHIQGVTNRPSSDNPAYRTVKTLAWTEDLDFGKVTGGGGIKVTGTGISTDPYSISNTLLPNSNKLTGTPFESSPGANPPYTFDKAFDNDITTAYVSVAVDSDPNTFVGLTLTAPNVITKVRIRPFTGQPITGTKIQGSNTSPTSGYVDLFTLPNAPFFQWSSYTIDSLTPYKYIRLFNASGVYQLAVYELEFYGYIAPPSPYISFASLPGDSSRTAFTRQNGSKDTLRTGSSTVSGSAGPPVWGSITGILSSQSDLNTALSGKASITHNHTATDVSSGVFAAARYGAGTVPVNSIAATGTQSATTYLRGDGTWATPPSGTGGSASIYVDSTLKGDFTLGSPGGGDTTKFLSSLYRVRRDSALLAAAINTKQTGLTITTTGTSGPSTLTGNTLNIPQYTGGTGSAATWGSITGTLANQTDLNTAFGLKAPLASPALTGTPTTPTASANTNNTQIATTAYADRIRAQLLVTIDSSTTAATIHTIVQQGGGAKIYRSVSPNVDSLRSIGNGPGLMIAYVGDTLIRITLAQTGVQIVNTSGTFAINDTTGSVYAYSADTIYLPSPVANQGRTIEINNVGNTSINIYTSGKPIDANGGILYWAGFTSLVSLPTHKNVRIRASGGNWYMVGGNL